MMSDIRTRAADAVIVNLPSHDLAPKVQQLIGKASVYENIEEFRGIPYATAPGRWQHSAVRKALPSDVYDATRNGQPDWINSTDFYQAHLDFPTDVEESEFDCLNLFVVRPSPAALARAGHDVKTLRLPVWFYIHGGGYGFGAATDPPWEPARLVKRALEIGSPFVAVFVNYRLGIFGFAGSSEIIDRQTDAGAIRGCNFGLGDQRRALEWTVENVAAFGGDPENITIGGQSAGSSSVHAHVIEAKWSSGEPLFRRAIFQSGALGTLGPISLETAGGHFEKLFHHLHGSKERSFDALFHTSAPDLLKAAGELGWWTFDLVQDDLTIRQGNVSRWTLHFGHDSKPLQKSENYTGAPLISLIGDTDAEGVIHSLSVNKIHDIEQVQQMVRRSFSGNAADKFLELYGLKAGTPLPKVQEQVIQFITDLLFGYPTYRARRELTCSDKLSGRPSETQAFRVQFGNPFPGPNYGVAQHCADLIYIFDCFYEAMAATGEESNQALVDAMQAHWIDFIVGGEKTRVEEGRATVYGRDRKARVEDMKSEAEWVARERRFELLGGHMKEAKDVLRQIVKP